MNAFRPNRRGRPALAVLTAILALVAIALASAAPAGAKTKQDKNCGKAVINDWFGDYRVDTIYPRHCYRDAIKALPVDVRDYSSAKDDILRALAYARQGKPDPGDQGSGTGAGGGAGGPGSSGGGGTASASGVDTSGPSSVPIPLLVLAGLATLLLALGAAGYLTRRMAARRSDDGGAPTEPPAPE